jgi:long-chain acyl-CoA synthetase
MSQKPGHDFTRVFDILAFQETAYPQSVAASSIRDGKWKSWSTADLRALADQVSGELLRLGVAQGDRIAIIPRMGSPEWLAVDLGCLQVGAVVVPIHPTSSASETQFILTEVEAKGCITADEELFHKVRELDIPSLTFTHHLSGNSPRAFSALGAVSASNPDITPRKKAVTAEDLAAILYTSGTTGTPKGAMLTHANLVSAIKSMLSILPLEPGQRALSFLPFSHIFERATCYVYLACGVSIHFSHSLDRLKDDFRDVRPRFFTSVPRTLEKMYDYLEEQRLSRNFFKRKLIGWAMEVGSHYKEGPAGIIYRLKLFAARLLVLNHWRKGLGGKVRFLGVGAAALRPEIGRLLAAAGIVPLAGYGMTEASPFISANRHVPGLNNLATVGLPVPGVDIRIDNPSETGEGEILVRGPNVMKGYYKRPDLTAEVLTADGWLRTGDVGKMVSKRFLALTDRKKDIFKTSSGKYVAPQAVQNHLTSSPFIAQSLVTGFNKPFVIAIIVPHFLLLKTWCEAEGIHWTAPTYMVHNIKVIAKYQEEIDRLNESLQSHERIRKFILSDEEWTVENKELTTSFKPMRAKLQEKHGGQIEKLYE